MHPGGPRVLDTVASALSLQEGQLGASRAVLSEHGNCSSVAIMLAIDQYAEIALGNREYFLNKPHSIGGRSDNIL